MDSVLAAAWRLPLLVRAAAALTVTALLWWSSSTPRDAQGASALRAFAHNGAHVVAFGGLAGACWMLRSGQRLGACRAAAALAAALVYGVVDELHQRHVPGRSCSVVDVVSDGIGAGLVIALLQWRLALSPAAARHVLLASVAALAAVSLATWGPW